MKNRIYSLVLTAAMTVSMLPTAAYAKEETKTEDAWFFDSDSITMDEEKGGDRSLTVTLTRSGNVSEAAKMTLLSYDLSADYGKDYTLSCDGRDFAKAEKITSLYAAYRDKRIISDYEENNYSFAKQILSYSGLELEGNEITPLETGTADNKDSKVLALSKKTDNKAVTKKNLADVDETGISYYSSISALESIGARSSAMEVFFDAGEKTKDITVTVKADERVEYDESFVLSMVNAQIDQVLQQNKVGTPDIPLKEGRDLTLATVTIRDDSDTEPECSVSVEDTGYIQQGEEKTLVTFKREGATETYSTVILYQDGEACGYFDFVPYQEVQAVWLDAGKYTAAGYRNCQIKGGNTITIEQDQSEEKTDPKLFKASALSFGDEQKRSAMGWFPDWAKKSGKTETDDYTAYSKVGTSFFIKKSSSGYGQYGFITDKNKKHNNVNVYNTVRLNTSGFLSKTKNSHIMVVSAENNKMSFYDFTGIESVESRFYVDDTDLNVTLGIGDWNFTKKMQIKEKGIQDIKVDVGLKPNSNDYSWHCIYYKNDNNDKWDGADVYFMNAFKLNKRKYQFGVRDSNQVSYLTKNGTYEKVKAQKVFQDEFVYLTVGENRNKSVAINTQTFDSYPMVQTGYCFLDGYNGEMKNSYVKTKDSQIIFNKDFLKKYESKYCYIKKRDDKSASYWTFTLQPVMEKIKLQSFQIMNNTPQTATSYNPYRGKLNLDYVKASELCQGDWATLYATDVQEGYVFDGVFVKYKKAHDNHWLYSTIKPDTNGKVSFRLEAGFSDYEVEPVFSGHTADTVTVTYARDKNGNSASEHGKLMIEGADHTSFTAVTAEEYRLNTRVPLNAKPDDGYITCWRSKNRTYYGNVFYYMMDGNSDHNQIEVDFIKKSSLTTAKVDYAVTLVENEVNIRTGSANANLLPITDHTVVVTSGKTYEAKTDAAGTVVLSGFEGVVGGTYSLMAYNHEDKRYRYMEFTFDGKRSATVKLPAFEGLAAYPDHITARVDGNPSNLEYVDLQSSGILEVRVTVYRPDVTTKLGSVDLLFHYESQDGIAKKEYTIEKPESDNSGGGLGAYSTYSIKVPTEEIPNMSYLYVNVHSSYEIGQSTQNGSSGKITIDNETGFVNSGYKFKTPYESRELLVQEEVPDVPGIEKIGGQDAKIPYLGNLSFGFGGKNGAFYSRTQDPNTGTVYLIAGYNVASTWVKDAAARYEGAKKTQQALNKMEQASRPVGDTTGSETGFVTTGPVPMVKIAPALCLKLALGKTGEGDNRIVGIDMIHGLDELIIINVPFSVYGVPFYVNFTFNGEEFFEFHAQGENIAKNGVKQTVSALSSDSDVSYFFQAPNLDLTIKTGVGFNAFLGIYISLGGNLKFNAEILTDWKVGGYFGIKGALGADLAIFSAEITVNTPTFAFGDTEARSKIHSAAKPLSLAKKAGTDRNDIGGNIAGAGMEQVENVVANADEHPVFTVNRGKKYTSGIKKMANESDDGSFLKSAVKNADIKLVKLNNNKMMAMTLADNGADKNSLNFLSAAYAISSDGGKTWSKGDYIAKSSALQWNIQNYRLKDKILMTWSEGDLDAAVGSNKADTEKMDLKTVAKAMTAFDLKGRYFNLDGKPLGDAFTIAKDENAALNSLDAIGHDDGTVDIYYESRTYNDHVSTMTELLSKDQVVNKITVDKDGKTTGTDNGTYIVRGEGAADDYRVMEVKAFCHNGIDGEVVVIDRDGKLMTVDEDGENQPGIDDRQIYIRVKSDKNGNIPADTLIPVTSSDTCAQHIVLEENGGHLYLFWNEDGTIKAASDFLPSTAQEYTDWKNHAENMGSSTIVSETDTLTPDTKFKVGFNDKGKGVVLWKNANNWYADGSGESSQIYAAVCQAEEAEEDNSRMQINGTGGVVALKKFSDTINNMDVQILDSGDIIFGYAQLDGESMLNSNTSDVKVDTVEEAVDIELVQVNGETYPLAGEQYSSYLTIWNNGLESEEDIKITASGAFEGSASLSDLAVAQGTTNTDSHIAAGELLNVTLPVKAAAKIADGDKVTYTVSQKDKVLATSTDTVKLGAYMVPMEMSNVVSIPGTDDYDITTKVINKGNSEGTTALTYYTYTQGTQLDEAGETKESDQGKTYTCNDTQMLKPGETTVISYRMENAAYQSSGIHKISVSAGEGYDQVVEGELPEAAASLDGTDSTTKPEQTQDSQKVKKGDIVTAGSGSTKAKYKVSSKNTVTYYKAKVSSGTTSVKVPDSIKISGKSYQVTKVQSNAFGGNKKFKKITIGKNVTEIQKKAMEGCSKINSILIKTKKLEKIGASAFKGCKKLKTLTVQSKKLSKKNVKNSLKGSSIDNIKTTSALKEKYKKYFAKGNSGRTVKIKKK